MPALQRLTTEYIEQEDRIRISGEGSEGELRTFWLTQRLLCRLIRYLISTIEEVPADSETKSITDERTNALFNEMAQQSAQQQIPAQPPVIDPTLDKSCLVLAVDVSKTSQHIQLIFKNTVGQPAELMLDKIQLRQWLSILCKLWQQAEWPLSIWPEWMLNTAKKSAANTKSAMH